MPLMTCIDIVYLWSSRLALCVTQLLCWGQMPRPTLTGLAVSTTQSNLIKVSHFINFILSGKKNTFILAVRCFYCAASMCFLPASCVFFFSSSRLRPRAAQPPRKLKRRWGFRPLCDKIDKESFSTKAKLSYAKLCKAMQSCVECASNCAWWEFHVDVCNFTMYLQVCKCYKCQIFNHFQELETRCNKQLFVCLSWSCWNKEAALQKNLKRRLNVLGLVALDLKIFRDFKELRNVGPQLLLVLRVLRVPFFHILSFGLEPAVLRSPWDGEAIGAATSAPGAHDRRAKKSQEEPRAQVISLFRLSMFLHVLSFLLMSVHFFSFMACHNRVTWTVRVLHPYAASSKLFWIWLNFASPRGMPHTSAYRIPKGSLDSRARITTSPHMCPSNLTCSNLEVS